MFANISAEQITKGVTIMITLPKQQQLTAEEVQARAQRIVSDFPSLLEKPNFKGRLARAITIATRAATKATTAGTIIEVYPGTFQVVSDSNPNGRYLVDTINKTCTCPDAGKGHICKHRLAVALYAGWFEKEKPAPVELHAGFWGYVTDPMHTRIRIRVKIVAIDAENNLVTMQTEPHNGSRPPIFPGPGLGRSCVGTFTPAEWLKKFNFAPDEEANQYAD